MEKNIKSLSFINVASFIFLICIWNFTNNMSSINKSLDDENYIERKLNARNYRLLAKCKNNNDSSMVGLKFFPYNEEIEIKHKTVEESSKAKNKYSNGSSSKYAKDHKQITTNKSNIFETKKYSNLEKKIFKELDYFDFLEKNRTISNKVYKQTIFKKYRLRIFAPVALILLLSIYIILDMYPFYGLKVMLTEILVSCFGNVWYSNLHNYLKDCQLSWLFKSTEKVKNYIGKCKDKKWEAITEHVYVENLFGYIVYIVPLIILGITLILGIFYYHKKVKKYQKLKFKKR
ncbi:fam-l protein [Plasmodium malariae]|uniref:Fam-l protein n=1 Tax=Plasmodium malariae TaxID=5858 RepID=A0A1D3JHI6_PLAMA|nr:fam-l protein [Plasmodium malariae]SBT85809.1 fam-l protein [Plasmodium malariae]